MNRLLACTSAIIACTPVLGANEPTGTQLLIDALTQFEQMENPTIHGRLPPRFVLSWEANFEDINDTTAIPAAEHEARLDAMQPVIRALIEATEAEAGPFKVSMLPEQHRNGLLSGSRRHAVQILLADAERMLLSDSTEGATDRVVAALCIIGVSLQDAQSGGFIDHSWEPFVGHLIDLSMLETTRVTLCLLVPHLNEHDLERIAAALQELEEARTTSEASLPYWYTIGLFDWITTYEGPFRWDWRESMRSLSRTIWVAVKHDDPQYLDEIPEQLQDLARLHPLTRRQFWPGIRQMHESAKLDNETVASLCRYAHATIRGEAGAYGITVQHDVDLFRGLAEDWFGYTDHIAAMEDLLAAHPPIPVDPGPAAVTFPSLRAAFNAQLRGAERGSFESTKRASQLAGALLDFLKIHGVDSLDEAEREAMLRDLENLRPDDPLRFEANSRRVTDRMYLDLHKQIETAWTTRDRFREQAPEWFASRSVPDAAAGVQQVIASIDPDDDFRNRLHELARGWLASEMSAHDYGEIRKLRYPADEAPQRWADDEIDEYWLHFRGPMATYLARDWFDDLVAVQEGARALWELRDLLEAGRKLK